MQLSRQTLCEYLDQLLSPAQVKDYCPNGLQVEGGEQIGRIVTGVTASRALIEAAIERQADAIVVHHGYFWRGESPTVTGMRRDRLKLLLSHDINLLAYHLPLDIHPVLGNNAQLAKLLQIEVTGPLEQGNPTSVVMQGKFARPLTAEQLARQLESRLGRKPLVEAGTGELRTVAWCTGGGQSYIGLAAEQGIDAFITGEVSEQTIHVARECGIAFFAAGHHATERYGVKALGEHLSKQFSVPVDFVDIANPA